MFRHLQIDNSGERWLVGCADHAFRLLGFPFRLLGARHRAEPRRVLLLRLERIGDLLMTRAALAAVREAAPGATVDLVVGSWNAALAAILEGPDRVERLDAPWLSRGAATLGAGGVLRQAIGWRKRRYDLAINFEGDIRSHLLMALSGAKRRVGFDMAGGGPLLTEVVEHDPQEHVAVNSLRLVERAFYLEGGGFSSRLAPDGTLAGADGAAAGGALRLPADARRRGHELLETAGARAGIDLSDSRPLVGIHAGGARAIKQWPSERFADVASRLARDLGAAVVLTGSAGDIAVNEAVRARLSSDVPVMDLTGLADLLALGAVLERLRVFVTVDSGPMHLAAALGTPVAAVFGPSDPRRWGPLSPAARAVRIDLPCSPCNRIRRPPKRCVPHVPDCLASVGVERVYEAAMAVMGREASAASRLETPFKAAVSGRDETSP